MEDNNTNQNTDPKEKGKETTEPTLKTFDEMLKESNYQSEFDKKVAKALETAKAKWTKEEENKRTEAENLAKMSADEKHAHEIQKITKEKNY